MRKHLYYYVFAYLEPTSDHAILPVIPEIDPCCGRAAAVSASIRGLAP
jgi:hypothetical protein